MRDQDGAPLADTTQDYRLPKNVTPKRYDIRLTPDLKAFTFQGEVNIAVVVNEATDDVVLNALELEIDKVTAERGGKSVVAKVELEPAKERAHLRFTEKLAAGEWTLKIAFRGILNDKLHGFYRSQYQDAAGKTHVAATTQFESTDARRAFPCWDEPELKASYKVTLIVDENLAAISNGGRESERKLGGGKKEVVFKETIAMSTYLVAFIVGEFDATAPVDAGTPLRIVHVPGKESLTSWAKQIGAFSLKYFADYYGLKYPGDKLDLIAIPDFASGAMENLGAITFRETALLADEKTASRAELERVADVVSHENAHMWFGDLVTMRWWNGIWLNEAFATFMEMLAVHAWKPEWKRWESFSVSRAAAMAIDGLRSTRPIEFTVRSPEDCRAMFDILTYEKGAAVLRMLEQFLGESVFRDGIRLYLKKHQFNNTETSDLWDALEAASREPVRKMMDSWIFQPGFPIIDAAPTADGRGLKISQRRFFYLVEDNAQLWHVPVMVRAKTDQGVSTHKVLLTGKETTIELAGQARMGAAERRRSRFLSRALRAGAARVDHEESRRAATDRALRPGERYVGGDRRGTRAAERVPQDGAAVHRRDRHQRVARADRSVRVPRHDRVGRGPAGARGDGARDRRSRRRASRLGAEERRERAGASVARHVDRRARHAGRRSRGAQACARAVRALRGQSRIRRTAT